MHRRSISGASAATQLPPIAACFLIRFDRKIGYTIAWKRSIPGCKSRALRSFIEPKLTVRTVEVEGAVEYNSLPSGLHNIREDLVYFTHEGYAGLSAFLQAPAAEAERNAQFVSVGILLPLANGRFGRGWLHAAQLKELASKMLEDMSDTKPLQDYWEAHGDLEARNAPDSAAPNTLSESITLPPKDHDLPPYHPILSLSAFLDEFGPLAFPLYRNALLRQRLLFLKKPPIRICCEYVYILSVLSSIPPILAESLLDPSKGRTPPLFTICIHDIPMLEKAVAKASDPNGASSPPEDEDSPAIASTGWIACSSDEVLATKHTLSDTRIKIPETLAHATPAAKQWPNIQSREDTAVKATQRDVRRYKALREGIARLKQQADLSENVDDYDNDETDTPLLHRTTTTTAAVNIDTDIPAEHAIVEPQSWAAIAYGSYMWWASAGERSADLQDEHDQDADLLFTAADVWEDAEGYARRQHDGMRRPAQLKFSGALEMAVVAYFHRLTAAVLETMRDLVEAADAAAEGGDDGDGFGDGGTARVFVSKDDLVALGVDPWSAGDREWVAQMIETYFDREADVQGASIECCGVKIY